MWRAIRRCMARACQPPLIAGRVPGGRSATGDETYLTFTGQTEHPEPGEVIFADDAQQAHARRWTNRQSGASAVRDTTTTALIVAEALHDTAASDVRELQTTLADALADALGAAWSATAVTAVLTQSAPRFGLDCA